ncbi:MAG: hypothetical protein OEZ10_08420 [Gammaproteobacteria bacterium]|nr:hypothetical protein [Gammaproteobacteria bacterium]
MRKLRNFLIDKRFQPRFGMELSAIVLIVPIAFWVNYFIIGQYVLIDELGSPTTDLTWGLMSRLLASQWPVILALYVVNIVLVGFLLLRYAHRVAGPVYRYIKAVHDLAGGCFRCVVPLRPNDYFVELGGSIEALAGNLSTHLKQVETAARAIAENPGSGDEMRKHARNICAIVSRTTADSGSR